ncbi:(2Fe-2S)-binding protein [Petrotoga sp. 9PWA.NaAc.5.4]|uniref:(2Fe-2S)-binding protein n=1 Tax=Petrotoga sp. 9PWA.NaAc.5.4 TaxID=1434328 RepID=UPI000CBC776B|nr:(2Fe-2S)-binding protein [Petrotoga sp. 9PWA.NaAc.5.4]PNR94838.1 sarcosine oxidase subunit alpha [Petrotoga sp. 9PWA.NaAc.5.4]
MRIEQHPILEFKRGKVVTFFYNGKEITAYEGETIAAALYASGIYTFSYSKKLNRPRGIFCAIGHCSSCLMEVDGVANVRTCVTLVKEGMKVKSQNMDVTKHGQY